MYINLGGGNFKQKGWINVDFPFNARAKKQDVENIDVKHNFMSKRPLPFKDNSVEVAYTEHCIEHLPVDMVKYLFKDVYRILKVGHQLRISCPDFDKAVELYNDSSITDMGFNRKRANESKERQFIDIVGTPLLNKWNDEQIKAAITGLKPNYKINNAIGKVTTSTQSRYPGRHLSCWAFSSMEYLLREIGYRKIRRMGPRQSKIEVLRSGFLDKTAEPFSLRVECTK